jgi:prevent-host-death family protein
VLATVHLLQELRLDLLGFPVGPLGLSRDLAADPSLQKTLDRGVMYGRCTDWYDGHMTTQMTATEVKAKILSLLDAVAAGEEIEITKHGRTVARLVPAKGPHALKGKLTGVAMSTADDEELFSTGATWDLP